MLYIPFLSVLFMALSCWAQDIDSNVPEQQCTVTALPKSINDFGAVLTQTLGGTDNLFISPMSIYTALAMTYLGSRGQTATQMEDFLQIKANGLEQGQLHESFKTMLDTFKNSNDQYSLLLGNGMFLQENYAVNESYTNDIQNYYNAIVKLVNFANNGEAAKNEINDFVAENTREKLKDFLKEPLDVSTVLALINAIYFKGTWKIQFDEDKTSDAPFRTSSGSTKQVKFMNLVNERFSYFQDHSINYRFLELPYKGGDVSMILALPNDYNQMPDLDMTSDLLCSIISQMRNIKVSVVKVPKFQLKYRKELVDTLKQLGITELFSDNADLTGISSSKQLKVSNVVHEAVIEVNEQGSEASAATGVFITRMSMSFNDFIADHPFTFYIVDKRNNLILFSGRVADP